MKIKTYCIVQICAFFILFSFSHTAKATNFRIKNLSLGISPTVACGASAVTDTQGDIIREYKSQIPTLVDMGTKECEVDLASFGGNPLSSPAKLLFLNDTLILVKIELGILPLASFVEIYNILVSEYGKATRKISRPFYTDTWQQRGQTLILDRIGRSSNEDVNIILRQDAGYKIYETRGYINSIEFAKFRAKKIKDDIN